MEPKIFYCSLCKAVEEVSYYTVSIMHAHDAALIQLRQLSWREYALHCEERGETVSE